jgi:hypothetical protein
MKSLRFLLALAFASSLLSVMRAGDDKDKSKDKSEKAVCTMDCKADKDGKFACSKDGGKTCCCGAEAKVEKKDGKAEPKH